MSTDSITRADEEPQDASEASETPESAQTSEVSKPSQDVQGPRSKGSLWLRVALAVAAVAIIVLSLVLFKTCSADGARSSRDPNAALGQLEGKSEEEIQAELDRIVEEGMFNVSISGVVEFADGTSEGNLCIENVPGNRYLMQVVITRDDTGEQIYETGIIDPNHHIKSDSLDVDLDAGEYPCTATFFASDPETEESVGQAAVKVTIKVLG